MADTAQISLSVQRFGLYLLLLQPVKSGRPLRTTVAFVPRVESDRRLGLHLYDSYWVPPIGVGSVRLWDTRTAWADLQPGPRSYHWEHLDSLVAAYNAAHVSTLLTLGMTPGWASSRPDEPSPYPYYRGGSAPPRTIDDWESFVRVVVSRYAGRIEALELWNEPNSGFLSGGARADAALLTAGVMATRAASASIITVGPTLVGHFVPWLDTVATAADAIHPDVFSMHTYTSPQTGPEPMLPLLRQTELLLKQHGWSRAIWVSEVGYWSAPRIDGWPMNAEEIDSAAPQSRAPNWIAGWPYRPCVEDTVAGFLVRQLAMYLGNGVQRLYWYGWTGRTFGLTDSVGAPRSPVVAYAAFAAAIRGLNAAAPISEGPVYAYRFSDGKRSVTVAWSVQPGGTDWVPTSDTPASISDLWGNPTVGPVQSHVPVRLGPQPLYVETVGAQ